MAKTKTTPKTTPLIKAPTPRVTTRVSLRATSTLAGFVDFLRERGVVGLAIAVVLGAAVTKLVTALVADFINPVVGFLLGTAGDLASYSIKFGGVELLWGHFLATLIDFVIVAAVIYFLVKYLKLDKVDKKK